MNKVFNEREINNIVRIFINGNFYFKVLAKQYNVSDVELRKQIDAAIVNGKLDIETAKKLRDKSVKNSKSTSYNNFSKIFKKYNNLIIKAINSKIEFYKNSSSELLFKLSSINDYFDIEEVDSQRKKMEEEYSKIEIQLAELCEIKKGLEDEIIEMEGLN